MRAADLLVGPLLAFAGLLAVAGVAKLRAPAATTRALRAAGLPSNATAVRCLGLVELMVSVFVAVTRMPLAAALLAAAYAFFSAYIVLVHVRGGRDAPCGCFGASEAPTIAPLHLLVTAVGVAIGIAEAWLGGSFRALDERQWPLAIFLIFVAVTIYLLFLALTQLPAILAALSRRPAPAAAES
jgi:uncharacterized membrane protein YphA (DoxX/SURF4 family)